MPPSGSVPRTPSPVSRARALAIARASVRSPVELRCTGFGPPVDPDVKATNPGHERAGRPPPSRSPGTAGGSSVTSRPVRSASARRCRDDGASSRRVREGRGGVLRQPWGSGGSRTIGAGGATGRRTARRRRGGCPSQWRSAARCRATPAGSASSHCAAIDARRPRVQSSPWKRTAGGASGIPVTGGGARAAPAGCRRSGPSRCRSPRPLGWADRRRHGEVGQAAGVAEVVGDQDEAARVGLLEGRESDSSDARASSSSALNGSSSSSTFGFLMRARASATRCCIPPDSSHGYRSTAWPSPMKSSTARADSRARAPSGPRCGSPSTTLSSVRRRGAASSRSAGTRGSRRAGGRRGAAPRGGPPRRWGAGAPP